MNPDATWHTSDEIIYLESIGTHSILGRSSLTRRELLESYREALKWRPVSERYLDFKRLRERVEELITGE